MYRSLSAGQGSLPRRPIQFGVGVKGGCEGVVHAVRATLRDVELEDEEKHLLQVDYENAFNQIDRSKLLEEVRAVLPEISAWVEASYGQVTHLNFGSTTLDSCTGVHQGDPLASLLYALGQQPVLIKIEEEVPSLLLN